MEVSRRAGPVHAMGEAQHSKSTLIEANVRPMSGSPLYLVQLRDFRIVMTAPIV